MVPNRTFKPLKCLKGKHELIDVVAVTEDTGTSNLQVTVWDGNRVWHSDEALILQHPKLKGHNEAKVKALDALGGNPS